MISAMNLITLLFVTIVSTITNASPVTSIEKRDVFTPPITYPTNTTVWNKGEVHNVTWDTSNAPVNITDRFGRIQLVANGIFTPVILADDFDLLLGTYPVTVPWVITGGDYQLVLFGDSGDLSPAFTINGATI